MSRRAHLLLLRVGVAAVLLVAAWQKGASSSAVVASVAAFDLVPPSVAVLIGLFLPSVEAAAGVALLLGYRVRAAAGVAVGLAAGFVVFVTAALVTGLDMQCGCFGSLGVFTNVGPGLLVFDLALLSAALYLARTVQEAPPEEACSSHGDAAVVGSSRVIMAAPTQAPTQVSLP